MKLALPMSLLHNLHVPQMLAKKRAIVEELEVQRIEDKIFIQVDKPKIQRSTHIIMLQSFYFF